MAKPYGLGEIVAGETDISIAGSNAGDDDLRYRGYSISQLVEKGSFEEVAYLLMYGNVPDRSDLENFNERIRFFSQLPEELKKVLSLMPRNSGMMDILKTSVSFLGQFDDSDDIIDSGISMLARIPLIFTSWQMVRNGLPAISSSKELSFAGNLLFLITGKVPEEQNITAMDKSLILYAEHEYNASTFAARVTSSTLSDPYSAVTSAIGTLKGSLHGGANEKAMEMILELAKIDNKNDRNNIEKWLADALKNKKKIMGFGHRVYKNGDRRAKIIKQYFIDLAERREKNWLVDLTGRIESFMASEKGIYPNLDFYAAPLYYILDIPINMYTPIFVASRITGWMAHIKEQRENNVLIRPRSKYTGPEQRVFKGML